jgi:radical SAM superfamily enzyme
MGKCDTCGNQYDKSFTVTLADRTHTFDCFECAIHLLAPRCVTCGTTIIGHGVEQSGTMFCCVHCAEKKGVKGLEDRV